MDLLDGPESPMPPRTGLHMGHEDIAEFLVQRTPSRTDYFALPSPKRVVEILGLLRRLCFPGVFDDDEDNLSSGTLRGHLDQLIEKAETLLLEQVRRALHYGSQGDGSREQCEEAARAITSQFMEALPKLRDLLLLDVKACMRGDPAAKSPAEIILCYPGIFAIFCNRMAHKLHELKVPLIPRIMSEHCHQMTAIDIHPGAQIGESFFIDHGTGVVIGETVTIGDNVKLFHGVTLGAKSTKDGQALAGKKRHPTIEDDVTIYAGAVILGGDTVIGKGSTVGGSVFITKSIPPGHLVVQTCQPPRLKPPRSSTGEHCFDPCI